MNSRPGNDHPWRKRGLVSSKYIRWLDKDNDILEQHELLVYGRLIEDLNKYDLLDSTFYSIEEEFDDINYLIPSKVEELSDEENLYYYDLYYKVTSI